MPFSAKTASGIPDPDLLEDHSTNAGWAEFPLDYTLGDRPPMQYTYDFGDDWQHAVLFEGFEQANKRRKKPVCVAGAGACPPEDCGGADGYADLLLARADPSHPAHADALEWTADPRDPASFSVAAVRFDNPEKRWKLAFEGGAF
jgi:hypothetical protein